MSKEFYWATLWVMWAIQGFFMVLNCSRDFRNPYRDVKMDGREIVTRQTHT